MSFVITEDGVPAEAAEIDHAGETPKLARVFAYGAIAGPVASDEPVGTDESAAAQK